jgi:transcriptional regulator with XRE-family HTH domain
MTGWTAPAARALLNISRPKLSRLSGVSLRSISGFENGETKLMRNNHEAIREALERAGVEFIGLRGVQFRNGY